MQILVIHGPNLNLLGSREAEHYGKETLDSINDALGVLAASEGAELVIHQSNSEGELIDRIQAASGKSDGILINPAAYTHTSVGIRDALIAVGIPAVEVHLSNPHTREEFRQRSLVADVVAGRVEGFRSQSYLLGLEGLLGILRAGGNDPSCMDGGDHVVND
jgi:3-dehydroquinate dehydratase-2